VRQELPGGYELDDDPSRLDVDAIHGYIGGESYWANGRSREKMQAVIDGSRRVIGLYAPDGSQAGFCRVVSDGETFAYLADVFVLEAHRGRGLGVWLVETIVVHPELARMRIVLATADAHGLYERFGFVPVDAPRWMERRPEG
jgi:GNAT superfamily N-acetyltransferase